MATATVTREQPKPPEVKSIVLELSPREAKFLHQFLNLMGHDVAAFRLEHEEIYAIDRVLEDALRRASL